MRACPKIKQGSKGGAAPHARGLGGQCPSPFGFLLLKRFFPLSLLLSRIYWGASIAFIRFLFLQRLLAPIDLGRSAILNLRIAAISAEDSRAIPPASPGVDRPSISTERFSRRFVCDSALEFSRGKSLACVHVLKIKRRLEAIRHLFLKGSFCR